ncbi:MAG: hypothetical protein NTW86_09765 [Candidatus Sumerlaeota bacterium]|nr:hypothetical protein [Candidatus Sumerlaeota bacterium]
MRALRLWLFFTQMAAASAVVAAAESAAIGNPLPLRPMHVEKGVLYYDDGTEVALWGVNYQIALSWEYKNLSRYAGIPLDIAKFREITDADFAQLKRMNVGVIRAHLLPSDFTDAEANLVDTVFLDALDYLIDSCDRNGIYLYVTLINEMRMRYLPDSFMSKYESPDKNDSFARRKEYYFDDDWTSKSRTYIKNLLNRTNRYTTRKYKDEPSMAVLEIQNEPQYPDFKDLDAIAPVRACYERWLGANHQSKSKETFNRFCSERVRQYIDSVCDDIRGIGARQPIVWNLNWARMIVGREDIFDAVAASAVDAVSFSLYPGQGDLKQPYWQNPADLSGKNYLPFLSQQYSEHERLGWALDERFASKAKLVYEFETFYNQSGYLYPAIARMLRALGVQMAPMWRYTMSPVAQVQGGSHYLNLLTTPRKALSFMIAGEVFSSVPRLTPYDTTQKERMVFSDFALSFPENVSIMSHAAKLMYSASLSAWNPLQISPDVQHIVGLGASELASYDGTGIYFIDIGEKEIDIEINPDAVFVRPFWEINWKVLPPAMICELDFRTPHRMTLAIRGWDGGCSVWRIENGAETQVKATGRALEFEARPGKYRLTK